jgi:type IV pilus assembly protein PilA
MNNLSIRKMNELSKGKKKGFTLVELIIVIAIIAVLAAIAIPKFGQISRDANVKADIATAKNIHGVAAQLIAEGALADVTDAKIAAKLDGSPAGLPSTKLKLVADDEFTVVCDADGDIHVNGTTSKVEIYPATDKTYK